ncbi:MAG: presqualene diphosphate synthase HpnD, partial [Actinomycetota bacterium]|nr:presqualene diphosphate synthase HpnD [Actinomycetota bacterium]
MTVAVDAAYRLCEEITRSRARNFYHGIRLLPAPRRSALCAVYALARRIDDIADGALAPDEKLRLLERARVDLAALDGWSEDPVLAALADAASRHPIPLSAFADLIDGAEMDIRGALYATFSELVVYCRRVAGSIGRLSLGVFEVSDRRTANGHADDLGVALQLTNILRDVHEDLARGRVYLPAEDLERFGCTLSVDGAGGPLAELVRFEAARARTWFERGLRLLPLLDRRSGACVAAMAGVYRRLLDRIERHPELVLRERLSLAGWEKGWVA